MLHHPTRLASSPSDLPPLPASLLTPPPPPPACHQGQVPGFGGGSPAPGQQQQQSPLGAPGFGGQGGAQVAATLLSSIKSSFFGPLILFWRSPEPAANQGNGKRPFDPALSGGGHSQLELTATPAGASLPDPLSPLSLSPPSIPPSLPLSERGGGIPTHPCAPAPSPLLPTRPPPKPSTHNTENPPPSPTPNPQISKPQSQPPNLDSRDSGVALPLDTGKVCFSNVGFFNLY